METLLTDKNGLYVLPLEQKHEAKLRGSQHILYGLMEAIFIGCILLPGDDRTAKFIFNIFFLLFAVFFGYLWLAMTFFNKAYLIVTDEYLEYKWLFGHKKLPFHSIYKAEFVSESGVIKLGIWADEQGAKRSFWERTDRLFGRTYSAGIAVSAFHHIDFEKLRLTILSKAGIQ
ncbi:hypothetical protein C2I18_26645 [Paenibacillus sp. PK3_47]|uniref:hypothetical protein n=1 Tax=Paenibacillus sp. PK3_47 TaxID=2072642 RepID=UPI00201E6697|nr:hypothetical protein [Paenibacillus sp. PK3_47]UQZ36793.1 hypothetical protein C2I18_26645 [Paenibacillus sp. PK3_47]